MRFEGGDEMGWVASHTRSAEEERARWYAMNLAVYSDPNAGNAHFNYEAQLLEWQADQVTESALQRYWPKP